MFLNPNGIVEELAAKYVSDLSNIIDTHAPLQPKAVTIRQNIEWYTEDLQVPAHRRRKAERMMCKTQLTIHKEIYKNRCRIANKLLLKGKKDYFSYRTEGVDRNNLIDSPVF